MTKEKTTIKQLEKVLELEGKGLSLRDIGKLVDLSHEGVRQLIEKYKGRKL